MPTCARMYVQLQCLGCGQRCQVGPAHEPWSTMPWFLQVITGRSTSPQKRASARRHQTDACDSDTGHQYIVAVDYFASKLLS